MNRSEIFREKNIDVERVVIPVNKITGVSNGDVYFDYERQLSGKQIIGFRVLTSDQYNSPGKTPSLAQLQNVLLTFINPLGDIIIQNLPAKCATSQYNGGKLFKSNMLIDFAQSFITLTSPMSADFVIEIYFLK